MLLHFKTSKCIRTLENKIDYDPKALENQRDLNLYRMSIRVLYIVQRQQTHRLKFSWKSVSCRILIKYIIRNISFWTHPIQRQVGKGIIYIKVGTAAHQS